MLNRCGCPLLLLGSTFLLIASGSSAQTLNCLGSSASGSAAAADEVNKGVEEYKKARYADAISHFERATNIAPCMTAARAYLATAEAQNVVPGLDTPDNLRMADQAIANFHLLLEQNPHDVNSIKQVAGIYFSIKRFDDAREWQKKVLVEDARDPEAAYTIGVIDWTEAHSNALNALSAINLMDDGEGNTQAPPGVHALLQQQNTVLIEEGLQYLTQAIENRPDYADAMAYLNLTYRRKADIDYVNPVLRDDDIAKAREWSRKSLLIRKQSEEKTSTEPIQPQ
jgi:tetratricopeptide (TPR) repeat protein